MVQNECPLLRLSQELILQISDGWKFDSEAVQRDLEAGQDGFLKLLLIATCPRLDSLQFVKRSLDPHTTLDRMAYVINKDSTYTDNWPQGFESLRNIVVGIKTDQRMNDENVHRDGGDFAALLYLPNLESLYFNDQHHSRDKENHPYFNMKFGIASFEGQYWIRKLIIYNPDGMHGYGCVNYRPGELDGLENPKLFTVAASDIELRALHQLYKRPNAEKLADYVSKAFPSSTEAIYIWGSSDVYVDDSKPRGIPSDTLDSALALLIESGVYENLKVIYLADVEK
ncbi:hypothetical protein FDENT_3302 [Fusarium denticulatum]|uniref:Uncharacterized protein n=1 Tax=Fusarium denticulatum TaxID=48507 RepID=A0A8H5XDH9_9HYPO|nr:hypothetical protein FDENT_3302 [Fusarium denticulatum]